MTKKNLDKFNGSRPHQNCILKTGKLEYENLKKINTIVPEGQDKGLFYLMLDQVTDP